MSNTHQLVKLFLIAMIFLSCTKEKLSDPIPTSPSVPSPLSGKEVIFDSLIWQKYTGLESEVYLSTPPLSSLLQNGEDFKYGYLQDSEVQLKFDTAINWMTVKSDHNYDNTLPVQYLYTMYRTSLVVNVLPPDFNLAGRKAAIKINFK